MHYKNLLASLTLSATLPLMAGVVNVGSGSYSDQFPGTDAAGRNAYPASAPQVSGKAATRPVPTNEWWCNELISNHGTTMFNYPVTLKPLDNGLCIMSAPVGGALPGDTPVTIGLTTTSATQTTVSDHSDWSVTVSWGDMEATSVHGSPMTYFTRSGSADVRVAVNMGTPLVKGNVLIVKGSFNGAGYAVYAPAGATWNLNGNVATTSLNGKNYWSAAMFTQGMDAEAMADKFAPYAFVFPKDTRVDYNYNEATGEVTAAYNFIADVKEGTARTPLQGLLPHHWGHLKEQPGFIGVSYQTVRGELKLAATETFTTSLTFTGILPTLPPIQNSSTGFSQAELDRLVNAVNNNTGLTDWTDTYNDGQLVNRLVQTARVAAQSGNTAGFSKAFALIKERVERWLTYSQGDIAFMFYYHKPWTSMLGYPAGHGQDSNINDHHFHWGYFIGGAAFVEQYESGWAAKYGDMVNLLVRDAASPDRDDEMFPFLRNFSVFGGHAWANGLATIGTGIDQESTSESMQFNSNLILWGEVTGNTRLRDTGIALYAIEQSAVEEYWFDANDRIFPDSYNEIIAARVFSNAFDCDNFWGAPVQGSYGIQVYPVHAGSSYLVNKPEFAKKFWNAIKTKTPLLQNTDDTNTWHDTFIKFAAMIDPAEALQTYNASTQLGKKFGVSQAQTYQWVHAHAVMGTPVRTITADSPLAMVWHKDGKNTYAAQNYTSQPRTVRFSDGFTLEVPARTLAFQNADGTVPDPTPDPDPIEPDPEDPDPAVTAPDNVPDPDHAAGNVAALFSHAYTPVTGFNVGQWEQTTKVEKIQINGKDTYRLSNFNYIGWEFSNNNDENRVDLSDYTHMHVDYWTPDGTSFGFTPISNSNGSTQEKAWIAPSVAKGEWNSYDVPLTHYDNVDMGNIFQVKFDQGSGNTGYLANVYFHKNDTGSETPDPNPTPDPDPTPDPTPSDGFCSYHFSQADGSNLQGDYTVQFSTNGTTVTVKAQFDGTYNDGAFFWNQSYTGDYETRMTKEGDWYTATIPNQTIGAELKYQIMLPVVGGQAKTKEGAVYTVGADCGTTAIGIVTAAAYMTLCPNPAPDHTRISVDGTGTITIYDIAGARRLSMPVDTEAIVDLSTWPAGAYIVRFVATDGRTATARLLH